MHTHFVRELCAYSALDSGDLACPEGSAIPSAAAGLNTVPVIRLDILMHGLRSL